MRALPVVSVFALALVSCQRDWNNPLDPGSLDVLTITSPAAGATVAESSIVVRGTYGPSVVGDIWVLVCPSLAPDRCWPQTPDAAFGRPTPKSDGTWSIFVGLGGDPQRYDIAVYAASSDASKIIQDTLIDWERAQDFPGLRLQDFPRDLVEKDRVTITKTR